MGLQISWYADYRVLYLNVVDNIQSDEAAMVAKQIINELDDSPFGTVHILVDARAMLNTSLNTHLLSTVIAPLFLQKMVGWMCFFGDAVAHNNTLDESVNPLFRNRYKIFDTGEDAIQYLRQNDRSLKNLLPLSEFDTQVEIA